MRPVFRYLLIFICICHFDALISLIASFLVQVVGLVLQAPGEDPVPTTWTGSPRSVKPLAAVFSRSFTS
jgi:hypothetical protein